MSAAEALAQVEAALDRVADPCSIATGVPIGIHEMGLVTDVEVADGHARVTLSLTSPMCWHLTNITDAIEREVGALDGIDRVSCVIDPAADWMPDRMAPTARARLRAARPLAVTRPAAPPEVDRRQENAHS